MRYCDAILPVPVEGTFTYLIPDSLAGKIGRGYRVIVPFGSKLYSAIVLNLHDDAPKGNFAVKDVADVLEPYPVLTEQQLQLWEWMADYYMCSLGDIYKAAMPAGLRLESETSLSVCENFDAWAMLKPKELLALELLQAGKAKNVSQLSRLLKDPHLLPLVKNLMGKGALCIRETIDSGFKPRKETHVRLARQYMSEDGLLQLSSQLERTPKRLKLLKTYLEMSGIVSALKLHNEKLVREVSRFVEGVGRDTGRLGFHAWKRIHGNV